MTDLHETAAIEEFVDAMFDKGIKVDPSKVIADGRLHRIHVDGDSHNEQNGWYVLHIDDKPAGKFGCNRRYGHDTSFPWTSSAKRTPTTAEERRAYREKMEAQRKQREEELAAQHKRAAELANSMWNEAVPCEDDSHPYLERKGVRAHGLRIGTWRKFDSSSGAMQVVSDNALLVPIRDADKNILSLQAIMPDSSNVLQRDKDYLSGGDKNGRFYAFGQPQTVNGREVVVIAEGYATGATVHEATGHAVIVAFDAPNLLPVANAIRSRDRFKNATLVIAADNDQWTLKPVENPGLTRAREVVESVDARIALPPFGPEAGIADGNGKMRGPTDWNDFALLNGNDAVKALFDKVIADEAWGRDAVARSVARAADADPLAGPLSAEDLGDEPLDRQALAGREPGSDGAGDTAEVRTITIMPGELPRVVNEAELALLEQADDIFQRAGAIVRPARVKVKVASGDEIDAMRLIPVTKHHLVERFTAAGIWQKYDARSKKFVRIDAPLQVAETYLSRDGMWNLRSLSGIISAPTLRADGSILDKVGYDDSTGLLLQAAETAFDPVPILPTKQDAARALARLSALVGTFPYVTDVDRSVAISAILTASIRRTLPTAPMHAFSAPAAGSGKSKLVDIASIIVSGDKAAVQSQGRNEEETEKRLVAAVLEGGHVISLDNCTLPLDGDFLCQMLTQTVVNPRVLGKSENRRLPTNSALFATGNSLVVQGDMTRRVLLCSLDPQCERPELREFDWDPVERAKSNRGAYVRDALTVLRAYHVAGRPRQVATLGSFEVWSDWVRSAMLWLGQPDPVATMEKARASDPKLEAMRAVMHQWLVVIGEKATITVADVIKHANETEIVVGTYKPVYRNEALREALMNAAGYNGVINGRSLGKWLGERKDKILDGMKFCQNGSSHGSAKWMLARANF
ncbi:toprim domain-containing protein [Paraburkholderia phenoliruptrix]|uniref:toprim domain-containing protein n=1 Tax=Paraburkholderia phenoliruptrix TaxID=252970 RepID=UPI001C4EF07F|nr:toprim domain-containing protein [Paraburkholderia phenoliruptrix]MBW0449242.1 toprim domain-containing protein [Paraburkholderia phenoliruptrix]MBW9097522.1 toprim domain-containing protein [Paraburkholderia phenoliruptrix]